MSDLTNSKYLTIVPYMPKGGVGKTTTTAHLGYALSEYGKTLLVDADPQGNLTNHLVTNEVFEEHNKTLCDFLESVNTFEDSIIEARPANDTYKGLYLLGTPNNSTSLQDYIQAKFPNNPMQFKKILKNAQRHNFKFVLIDPPASFNFYTRFIISLSSHVIPVIQPESFGYEALIDLVKEISDIEDSFECSLNHDMALINKFDVKNSTHRHYLKEIQESPFNPFFVINDTKSIPFSCSKSILLQEYKPDNPINRVFDDTAAYFNNILNNNKE